MARVVLSIARLSAAGVQPAPAAFNADGYKFRNDGSIFLLVENTNGASAGATVTAVTPITVGGHAVEDEAIAVAAGETHLIGPFDPSVYNHRSGSDEGAMYLEGSGAVADLVIQAFRAP